MICKLPIKAARDIADTYGWDQVIIIARKTGDDGYEHVVTYGKDRAHCEVAARAGNAIKHHLMQWPCSLFDSDLRVLGIGRDVENPRSLSVALNMVPSDHDIQMVHDMLRPPTHSPAAVENGLHMTPEKIKEARALVERLDGYTPGPWT